MEAVIDVQGKQDTSKSVIHIGRLPSLISVHLLALAITVAVLYLDTTETVFADATALDINAKLSSMQFVARVYEFVLSISLAHIVLDHVRSAMLSTTGIYFGHSTAAFQLGAPQYLMSKAYWIPTWRAIKTVKPWQMWTSFLILATITLTVLAGPSSAVMLVPQLTWSPVQNPFSRSVGTTFLAGTYETLYPSHIDSTWIPQDCEPSVRQGSPLCPNAHVGEIGHWASSFITFHQAPNLTFPSTLTSFRSLASTVETGNFHGWAGATAITYEIARSLGNLWLYVTRVGMKLGAGVPRPRISLKFKDGRPILQPLVQVQCSEPKAIGNESTVDLSFPAQGIVPGPGPSAYTPFPRNLTVQTKEWTSRNHSQVRFVGLSNSSDQEDVLGAIIGFSFNTFNPHNITENVRVLFGCTLDFRWIHADMSFEPMTSNIVTSANSDPKFFSSEVYATSRHIYVNTSFANALNAVLPDYQLRNVSYTVFEYPIRFFYNDENAGTNYTGFGDRYPWMFGTSIALQMTEALSSIRINRGPLVWIADEKPPRVWDIGGSFAYDEQKRSKNQTDLLFISPEYARTRPDLFTEMTWITERFVYAWGFRGTPAYLSLLIIGLHIFFIVYYLSTALIWNRRCDSWGDLLGFLSLALQSYPAPSLGGSRSAVQDTSVYVEPMCIREDLIRNRVELHVGQDISLGTEVISDKLYDSKSFASSSFHDLRIRQRSTSI